MTDEQVNDSGDMSDNADEMIDDEGVVVAEDEVNVIAIEMAEAEVLLSRQMRLNQRSSRLY